MIFDFIRSNFIYHIKTYTSYDATDNLQLQTFETATPGD